MNSYRGITLHMQNCYADCRWRNPAAAHSDMVYEASPLSPSACEVEKMGGFLTV